MSLFPDNDTERAPVRLRKGAREFRGWSDHIPFKKLGIPCSGIFTGSEPAHDECIHRPCDTNFNPDRKVLADSTAAAIYGAAKLLCNSYDAPLRNDTQFDDWDGLRRAAERSNLCNSPGERTLF